MKLSPWTIIIIGLSIGIAALSFGYFFNYMPNVKEAEFVETKASQLETEANKMAAAQKRVENAIEDVNRIAAEWQAVVARRTPSNNLGTGGINLAVNRYQLTVDAPKFRNNVQRAVNAQLKKGGVVVVSGVTVPQPSDDPNQVVTDYFGYTTIARFPVSVFELGTVTIRGTWNQISAHMRAWSTMPNYLAVTDGLAVSGTSPNLTATYNLVVVAYIRGQKIAPPVTAAASTGPGGGGGAPAAGGFGGAGPPTSRGGGR